MLMTEQTFELRKVGWIDMAICTIRPLPLMLSTINREEVQVMVECRSEPLIGVVTTDAVG